jgi:Na+/proline symporter
VASSHGAMTGAPAPALLGIGFCAALALFAILFGTRDVSARVQSDGLTAAIAFESLVKLSALVAVGAAAIASFGGLGGVDHWLAAHPEEVRALQAPMYDGGSWFSLVLLSFASAFVMPRQFHVAFAEGTTARSLRIATWAFPLYLFLLNLPVLPILWAGGAASPASDPDFYVIVVARVSGSPALAALAFLGGVSAASAMVLVTLLALSAMCLNHIVLPARPVSPPRDLWRHGRLRALRRGSGALRGHLWQRRD